MRLAPVPRSCPQVGVAEALVAEGSAVKGSAAEASAARGSAADATAPVPCQLAASMGGAGDEALTFDSVYRTYARFVWRCACRLGIADAAADDVVQDVFLVVHRRLHELEDRTSLRAWLSAIVVHVVRTHRRTLRRKFPEPPIGAVGLDPSGVIDGQAQTPLEHAERHESVRRLYEILSQMRDEMREVFVLSELAELTAPEIARALSLNVNTVYFRIRSARREFESILFRKRAKEERTKEGRDHR